MSEIDLIPYNGQKGHGILNRRPYNRVKLENRYIILLLLF